MIVEGIERKITPILKQHGVVRAGLFGSIIRGEASKKSDIDILVKFRGRKSLLDVAGLELKLEKVLGRKVDLVEYCSIHPLLKESILGEEVRIYEKG